MNKEDAANVLGVSTKTVVNYSNLGLLEVTYIKGKTRPVADYNANAVHALKAKIDSGEIQIGKRETESRKPRNENPSEMGNQIVPVKVPISRNQIGNHETGIEKRELGNVFVIGPDQLKDLLNFAAQSRAESVAIENKYLLTIPEAMALSGIKEKPIRDAIKAGVLQSIRIGRSIQIRPSDLSTWVDSHFK